MLDGLSTGHRFRVFTLIDTHTRECLALVATRSFTADRVTEIIEEVVARRRARPQTITVDNGPEFTSRRMDYWAHLRGVELDFIRPGRPVENCYIESFNGRFRDECLNTNWFEDIEATQKTLDSWKEDYNNTRPHSSLGQLPPTAYAQALFGLG